jgi:hypothetical protein
MLRSKHLIFYEVLSHSISHRSTFKEDAPAPCHSHHSERRACTSWLTRGSPDRIRFTQCGWGRRTVDHWLTLGRGRFLVAPLLVRAPSLPIIQSERARLAAS